MGTLPRNQNAFKFAPIKHRESASDENVNDITVELPEKFDARERWPECRSVIASIKDQSNCGSCWVTISGCSLRNPRDLNWSYRKFQAVSAASVFSDRLCIASRGVVAKSLSAEQLNSCCYRCGHGCDGGIPEGAWYFFSRHGIVTGGDYGSFEVRTTFYAYTKFTHWNKNN